MNRFIAMVSLVAGLAITAPTYAWVYSPNVSVIEITEWQDGAPVYFKLSNGTMCYVPAAEKNMYSLILSMYVSGKRAHIHCADSSDIYGGMAAYRVHRVVSFIQ
jgi:hypothetical protein